ncbi:MAG: heme-binding domain-containing protein [Chlorobaculum sp.]|nr:heme-binding domain-containing protein [Chlorobaculum sp.]
MNNKTGAVFGWVIIALILIQFIPLDRVSHPSKLTASIPATVLDVLEARCLDCHSSGTRWPRSAWIAPLSWHVTGKVRQAREAMDLSNFDELPEATRREIERAASNLAETANLSKHGAIPGFPPIRISERERRILGGWISNNNREQKVQ